jgi:subtilase family serine protease
MLTDLTALEGTIVNKSLALLGVLIVPLLLPATATAASSERYARHPIHARPLATTSPTGLSPDQIKSAYGFSTSLTAGAGKTIAIVDAYDDPTAESDLGVFSSQFGLPACTTSNGCFKKVNQSGNTKGLPRTDAGWALEIALDIEWAHGIAPGAKILLVEARSSSLSNLFAAEDYAKTHAQYVSNSWGTSEFSVEHSYDGHFSQSGVSFFASSGDGGSQIWPSTSPNVISVGGTTLTFNADGSLASETGWSGSGGGCSAYEAANPAQNTGSVNCGGRRGTPDVSLDADPNSGVSVYDSTPYSGEAGWWQVGGTSASSPMWAARSADAGVQVNGAYVYGSSITYRDITAGANNVGSCQAGYDLVTGRGSWTGSTP